MVVDTYEDVESMSEPKQRCYCKVKIFRDKVSLYDYIDIQLL